MARKKVNLEIWLKDHVSGPLMRIKAGIGGLIKSMFNLQNVVRGLAISAPFIALGAAVKKAFNFETAKTQLKTLLGSARAASERFKELRDFSASTPFQLPDILKASRLLTVFSEGALGSADSLRVVGDAASVAGQEISDVAFWVGRAYSLIKGGQPFGEAATRLQEMGILSAQGRDELEKMIASGASFETTFSRLQKELRRFSGGMGELSTTGNGLISTLKDNWTIAVATFGETFMDAAKGGLTTMINTLKELTNSGTITKWAEQAKTAFDYIVEAGKIIALGDQGQGGRVDLLKNIGNVIVSAFLGGAKAVGAVIGIIFDDFGKKIGTSLKDGALDLSKKGLQLTIDMGAALGAFILDLGKKLIDVAPTVGQKIADAFINVAQNLFKGSDPKKDFRRGMPSGVDVVTGSSSPRKISTDNSEETELEKVLEKIKKESAPESETKPHNSEEKTISVDLKNASDEVEQMGEQASAAADGLQELIGTIDQSIKDIDFMAPVQEAIQNLKTQLTPPPEEIDPVKERALRMAENPEEAISQTFVNKLGDAPELERSLRKLGAKADGSLQGGGGSRIGEGLAGGFSGRSMLGQTEAEREMNRKMKQLEAEKKKAEREGKSDDKGMKDLVAEATNTNKILNEINEKVGGVSGG